MASVLSALTSPFFELIDLSLESPWAALGIGAGLAVLVFVLSTATP